MVAFVDQDTGEVLPPQFAGRLKTDSAPAPPADGPVRQLYTTVPCGTCDACKLERSRQWAVRCMHEASLYDENCFISLTYADKHLPWASSLWVNHFQDFMKRLRKQYTMPRPTYKRVVPGEVKQIRFFHCGEYGETYGRPHYHALLFGFNFPDRTLLGERRGFPIWRSPSLEQLWPYGRSEIGTATFESAAYVARYVLKKQVDTESPHELRDPEYVTMSRRPGIGKPWLDLYQSEVYPRDSVIRGGMPSKPPRYYDVQVELSDPSLLAEVRRVREDRRNRAPTTLRSRHAEAEIVRSKLNLKKRELE